MEGLPEEPLAAYLYADAYAVYAQGALYSFSRAAQQHTLRIRGKADPDFRPIARAVGTYYGEIHEALCFADGIYALPSECDMKPTWLNQSGGGSWATESCRAHMANC